MNCLTRLAAVIGLSVGLVSLCSCNCDKKPEEKQPSASSDSGAGSAMVMTSPGEAGGVAQDSFTVSAKVTEVEKKTREIELTSEDGSKATFVAGPEIRNFDQIREGDTVTATVTERLVVFVRSDGEDPSVTHASALATAPKGAKPGATLAQSYEVTAKVTAIDSAKRTAELTFSNGQTRTIPVRKDVELSRYKVGDTVVIRVTEALTVVVKSS